MAATIKRFGRHHFGGAGVGELGRGDVQRQEVDQAVDIGAWPGASWSGGLGGVQAIHDCLVTFYQDNGQLELTE